MAFRVKADVEICQAHQLCQGEAPEVFGFDEDLDRVVVLQEYPDESQRAAVRQAVKYCPAMVLDIEEIETSDSTESQTKEQA
ncbi:MAG: ferredoxin [Nocardioides sp.]|jgi:ferredoxin